MFIKINQKKFLLSIKSNDKHINFHTLKPSDSDQRHKLRALLAKNKK